jgi:hypothetical protein
VIESLLGNTVCDQKTAAVARANVIAHPMSAYDLCTHLLMRLPLQCQSGSGEPDWLSLSFKRSLSDDFKAAFILLLRESRNARNASPWDRDKWRRAAKHHGAAACHPNTRAGPK